MSKKSRKEKSTHQRIANRASELELDRDDGFTTYAMDRLLYRLGQSEHAKEFYLKGGVRVANLLSAPHRFTRDIDTARSHGACDTEEMRKRFRAIIALPVDDGVTFDPNGVSAVIAEHDRDGYDGITVKVRGNVGAHPVQVKLDIGFGDVVVPPAERARLAPYLPDDAPAHVYAYPAAPVIAEKVETLIAKFPAVGHRLKDLLDVVVLSAELSFDGTALLVSLRATFERRATPADTRVLDDMATEFKERKWQTSWATMCKEKRVRSNMVLADALRRFDAFVRPLLEALASGAAPPKNWPPDGPWGTT